MTEIFHDCKEPIQKLTDSPGAKLLGSIIIGLLHQLFGEALLPAHTAVMVLVALDWICGISYAITAHELSSSKSLRGVIKLALYGGIFIVCAQLDKIAVIGSFLNGSLAGLMVLTEAISVLENIEKLARVHGIELTWLDPVVQLLKQRQCELMEQKELKSNE